MDSPDTLCPHCGGQLACSYYKGGRVVQCENCGLRGPKSSTPDDPVDAPRELFDRCCRNNPHFASIQLALQESLRMQSLYAAALNMVDGGRRLEFRKIGDWLEYLSKRGTLGS